MELGGLKLLRFTVLGWSTDGFKEAFQDLLLMEDS